MFINEIMGMNRNKRQKDCLWKQRTHDKSEMELSRLLRLFISSNEIYNTAYTL